MRDLITLIENQEISPALLRLNKIQASLKKNGFVKSNNRYVLNKDGFGIIVSLNWSDKEIQVYFTLMKKNMVVTQRWFDEEKINGWRREWGNPDWQAKPLSDEPGNDLDEVSFIAELAANPQRFVDKSFVPVRAKQITQQSFKTDNMSAEQPETQPAASPTKLADARATWDRHQADIDKASEKLRELKQIQRDTWSEIMGHPRKK